MNFWKEIESNLWNEGFDVMNENDSIEWQSEKGSHRIDFKNIAIDKDKLAWYQDEEYGRCWVKIKYPDGIILNWRPISNHPDWGFRLKYIKWFKNQLIVIYGEKHCDFIIKIDDLKVEELYCNNIAEIQIIDNLIFVKNFSEIVLVINLNLETSEIVKMPYNEFKMTFPKVKLEPEWGYFVILDENYNKNYS